MSFKSLLRAFTLASGVLIFIPLSACDSGDLPDCGRAATIDTIINIAKNNPDNKLVEKIQIAHVYDDLNGSNGYLSETAYIDKREAIASLKSRREQLVKQCHEQFDVQINADARISKMVCNGTFGVQKDGSAGEAYARQYIDPIDQQIGSLEKELVAYVNEFGTRYQQRLTSSWNTAIKQAIYKVSVIRTTSKDSETKTVICAAKLSVTIPDRGSSEADIAYKVEITSENKIYVTAGLFSSLNFEGCGGIPASENV
jgi:hypothetical protein